MQTWMDGWMGLPGTGLGALRSQEGRVPVWSERSYFLLKNEKHTNHKKQKDPKVMQNDQKLKEL